MLTTFAGPGFPGQFHGVLGGRVDVVVVYRCRNHNSPGALDQFAELLHILVGVGGGTVAEWQRHFRQVENQRLPRPANRDRLDKHARANGYRLVGCKLELRTRNINRRPVESGAGRIRPANAGPGPAVPGIGAECWPGTNPRCSQNPVRLSRCGSRRGWRRSRLPGCG